MPTVLRVAGFRFYFHSHVPNEPPHVHVDRSGASAKIWPDKIGLASNAGFSAKELGDALRLVLAHQAQLLAEVTAFIGRKSTRT